MQIVNVVESYLPLNQSFSSDSTIFVFCLPYFCCCPHLFVLIKSPAMQIYHICYFSNLLSRKPVFMKLCSAYLFWRLCSASRKPTKLHKRGEIWVDGICLFRYQTQHWLFYSVLIDWEFFRCLFQDLINMEV